MPSGREIQLTKQIGEYLVAAELCRRDLITTTFTGNVPDFDIIAINKDFKTIPIQVKTIRRGNWQFDARRFLNIEINNGIQRVIGKESLNNPDLICIFVRLNNQGSDEFYIFRLGDLQKIICDDYNKYLQRMGERRPRNKSTHCSVSADDLKTFKDNWFLIMQLRTNH